MKRFKNLATKMTVRDMSTSACNPDGIHAQLANYIQSVQEEVCETDAIDYWKRQSKKMSTLTAMAEDVVSAPASQAYVERLFSLAGMLTSGRRNKLTKSLEMRVFLKLNRNITSW